MLSDLQLKKLNQVFAKYQVLFAYLFGSQVTDKANQDSDYDIAIFLAEQNKKKRFDQELKIAAEVIKIINNDKLDLVVLNDTKSIFLKFVIISEGKLIYNNDLSAHIDFELRAMNEYWDFKPFLEAYNKAYSRRILSSRSSNFENLKSN